MTNQPAPVGHQRLLFKPGRVHWFCCFGTGVIIGMVCDIAAALVLKTWQAPPRHGDLRFVEISLLVPVVLGIITLLIQKHRWSSVRIEIDDNAIYRFEVDRLVIRAEWNDIYHIQRTLLGQVVNLKNDKQLTIPNFDRFDMDDAAVQLVIEKLVGISSSELPASLVRLLPTNPPWLLASLQIRAEKEALTHETTGVLAVNTEWTRKRIDRDQISWLIPDPLTPAKLYGETKNGRKFSLDSSRLPDRDELLASFQAAVPSREKARESQERLSGRAIYGQGLILLALNFLVSGIWIFASYTRSTSFQAIEAIVLLSFVNLLGLYAAGKKVSLTADRLEIFRFGIKTLSIAVDDIHSIRAVRSGYLYATRIEVVPDARTKIMLGLFESFPLIGARLLAWVPMFKS